MTFKLFLCVKIVLIFFIINAVFLIFPKKILAQTICQNSFVPVATPLIDLGNNEYTYYPDRENPESGSIQFRGGLYDNGVNQPPQSHINQLNTYLNQITPLNSSGNPDPTNGYIGFMAIGMSNTSYEFGRFKSDNDHNPIKNPRVKIVNTALSSATADYWDQPGDYGWTNALNVIQSNNLSPNQIQVAWMKTAIAGPQNEADHVDRLYRYMIDIARTAKQLLPNLKIIYVSSRTRSYAVNQLNVHQTGLNSDPQAYEAGFAVRKLILEQIQNPSGQLNLNSAPLLIWGPYIWIDGQNPRSDGMVWLSSDLENDCTHPSIDGRIKVSGLMTDYFSNSPFARNWFRGEPVLSGSPTPSVVPTQTPVSIPGDVDYDGDVDIIDYQLLSLSFGKSLGDTGFNG